MLAAIAPCAGFLVAPAVQPWRGHAAAIAARMQLDIERKTGDNVEQIKDTKRDKVMTFSYDMSLDTGYEKPTYPGTGNGLGGEGLQDEYDVVVIGSGMGGLACGALSAEYGSRVAVIESHIKPGGSAHTFTRVHKGGKYSFEVGPSIFEGLNGPSLNPLRTILDMLGEAPLRTWAPGQGHAQTLSRCRPETSGTPAFGSSVPAAPLPTAAIFQPLPFDRPPP
ncbi:hypothetical protein EMIHUDRAFT_251572 [Emiliania huxleyi CCMP1516]|uniref:Amine oxidase domain-containing protein n=2 Tax=Emiliania huxleyi TaxID=2903 RepID=A0A0D3KT82_EMIH1|nr:hypothetical protein EMIHUDRAFT_251572 [Emiliania huxleyi CCMP1516]EOD38967.1 hypothetical protein EMIHUDRAFT_251572 [Emiliania huxleyi CCMP1516]|eukprot:XP_005791396.1 hypothetical protein EMIHUDRAFT_251572 [Emiliania huxleyi CCMP1516]